MSVFVGRWMARAGVTAGLALCLDAAPASQPNVQTIIEKSVEANNFDFKMAPRFDHQERDRTSNGTKTYQVTMIEGSPYQRLIAENGKPLAKERETQEMDKQRGEASSRSQESREAREERIAKYEKDRKRDQAMMSQLTKAFDFTYLGEQKMRGFTVYALKATPRPGYQPPNMETQVLPGMQGKLWIDEKTYQWVKVTARVIHPVSIEGFLAQVEPGTQFELEKMPVNEGAWAPSHFSMKAQAKVLFLFNHDSSQDTTYLNYKLAEGNGATEERGRQEGK